MKKCSICKKVLNKNYFHSDSSKPTGLRYSCKDCEHERYIKRSKYLKEYRIKNKKYFLNKWREWESKNHKQYLVNQKTDYAIRTFKIKKESCSVCGNKESYAHHDDYSKPFDVIWLCRTHHGERHRKLHSYGDVGVAAFS